MQTRSHRVNSRERCTRESSTVVQESENDTVRVRQPWQPWLGLRAMASEAATTKTCSCDHAGGARVVVAPNNRNPTSSDPALEPNQSQASKQAIYLAHLQIF